MLGEIIMEFNQFAYHHQVKNYSLKELDQELVKLETEAMDLYYKMEPIAGNLEACETGNINYSPQMKTSMENSLEKYLDACDVIEEKQKMLGLVIKKLKAKARI